MWRTLHPNKRMSASERLRMEARDVWSEDELEYPEVRYAASFTGIAIVITRRGRAIDATQSRRRRDTVTATPSLAGPRETRFR